MATRQATTPDAATWARFAPLRDAEWQLVQACATGEIAKIGLRRPEAASAETRLRASFLAWVLCGGLPLRGGRLELVGAHIEGRLDLGDAHIAASVWFYRCRFDAPVLLDGAHVVGSVTFAGCRLQGLLADGCRIGKDLAIHSGTVVDGELRLRRARIGGDLDCARLDLSGGGQAAPLRRALLADGVRVGGEVRLTDGFQAVGDVQFVAAQVRGDFLASGHFSGSAREDGRRGCALLLDRLEVGGSLSFTGGFGAAGCVSLQRARIGGDLDATGASFDWLGDAGWTGDTSLQMERARIGGTLVLRELMAPLSAASLADAKLGALADDGSTWGERLVLDGLRYRRLAEGSPTDAASRIDWLQRQEPAHLGARFRPQPWRQAIRVLHRMGHAHAADSVALRRERALRRAGVVGSWAPAALRWLPRLGHGLLGLLAGHGYRPGWLAAWLAGAWLLCGAVYGAAAEQGAVRAAPFSPWVYSFDRLLPPAGMPAPGTWITGSTWGEAMHWLSLAETGFGWLAWALLLASVAGWLDRDRRTR
jgi:hypothetical protein